MRKLKTFLLLPTKTKILLPIVFFLSLYTYILFKFFNHKVVYGIKVNNDNLSPKQNNKEHKWLASIKEVININKKYTPWNNVCRHQAYQAKILCYFFKIPLYTFIGVKKNEKGAIEGHAWTTASNKIITGMCNPKEYTIKNIYLNS